MNYMFVAFELEINHLLKESLPRSMALAQGMASMSPLGPESLERIFIKNRKHKNISITMDMSFASCWASHFHLSRKCRSQSLGSKYLS